MTAPWGGADVPNLIDLEGAVFGEWRVQRRDLASSSKQARWICKCSCGAIGRFTGQSLRRSDAISCGSLAHTSKALPENPEREWRDVLGWEGIYQVSNLGEVRRVASRRSRRQVQASITLGSKERYARVNLMDGPRVQRVLVHVLVCEAFHGPRPSPGHQAAHRDCNKKNNRWDNLRWATAKANRADERKLKLNPSGQRNPNAKLTHLEVKIIRRLYANGLSQSDIGRAFEVSTAQISHIIRGSQWNLQEWPND